MAQTISETINFDKTALTAAVGKFFDDCQYGGSVFAVPFFRTRQFDGTLLYVGDARKWDKILFKGDVRQQDFLALYVKNKCILAATGMKGDREMADWKEFIRCNRASIPEKPDAGSVNFSGKIKGCVGLL